MRSIALLAAAALVTAGCAGDPATAPAAKVTVTRTVTATASPSPVAPGLAPSDLAPSDPASSDSGAVDPDRELELTVHTDGCGVIRPETKPGDYRNLTWSIRDTDGFQVLGRNAEGETRYRYFQGGTYTLVLEAWGEATGGYVPVSNEVTIRC